MNNPKMGMCGGYWRNDKGQFHREDGPAIEWFNDDKEWWINGEDIGVSWNGFTQEDFERYLKIKEYW